jgi:hypothetical protein
MEIVDDHVVTTARMIDEDVEMTGTKMIEVMQNHNDQTTVIDLVLDKGWKMRHTIASWI